MTAKTLRAHLGAVLARLDRGESVTITYRGKPRARLVALPTESAAEANEMPAFGMWQDRDDMADVPAYVRDIRKPRPDAGDG